MKKSAFPITAKATLPAGFRAAGVTAGLKSSGAPDMALFFSDSPATAAAVFTTNQVQAAPVRLNRERVNSIGLAHGIVVNSGQANACTGRDGMRDAQAMAAHAADRLGIAPEMMLACSTGRIGVPLRMDLIRPGIDKLRQALSPTGGESAAKGILTTDTRAKRFTATFKVGSKTCRMTGIAKGAGMIQPCMATMLAFLLTDAQVDRQAMQHALKTAVDRSFNRISVDADQSTNDTVLMLANGRASDTVLRPGRPGWTSFVAALEAITFQLAMEMVRDGEGATKLVTVQVNGARSAADAEAAARSVANSFLVKTSWVGTDANWGRVMDALGYSAARINENKVEIHYDQLQAVRNGIRSDVPAKRLSKVVCKKAFTLTMDLHLGRGSATVYSCDCTEEYVRINV